MFFIVPIQINVLILFFFFNNFIYLFRLCGVFSAVGAFLSCRERGGLQLCVGASHCSDFSCRGAPALG